MPELKLPPYYLALEALRPTERRTDDNHYDRIDPKPEAAELAEAMSGLGYRVGHAAVSDVVEAEDGLDEDWDVFQPHLTSEELAALPDEERDVPYWNGRSWRIPCDHRTLNLGVVSDYFRPPKGWHSVKNYRLALADRYRELAEKITDQGQGSLWVPSWLYFNDRSLEAGRVPQVFQRESLEAAIKEGADVKFRGNSYYSLAGSAISACLPASRPERERRKLKRREQKGPAQVETVDVEPSKLIMYVLENAPDSRSLWFDKGVDHEAEGLARAAVRMKYRPSQEESQRIVDHAARIWELLQLHTWQHTEDLEGEIAAVGA